MNKKTCARLALLAGCCLALPAAAQDLVISNARILDGAGNALAPTKPGWGFSFDPDAVKKYST